jgi:hypothetical protein
MKMEERSSIWRVSVNLLNEQTWTADKGGPPSWGLGEMLKTSHRKKLALLRNMNTREYMIDQRQDLRLIYPLVKFTVRIAFSSCNVTLGKWL